MEEVECQWSRCISNQKAENEQKSGLSLKAVNSDSLPLVKFKLERWNNFQNNTSGWGLSIETHDFMEDISD